MKVEHRVYVTIINKTGNPAVLCCCVIEDGKPTALSGSKEDHAMASELLHTSQELLAVTMIPPQSTEPIK